MAAVSHNRATWKVRAERNKSACTNKVIAPVVLRECRNSDLLFPFLVRLVASITSPARSISFEFSASTRIIITARLDNRNRT